jgi:hypothetical protein
VDHHGVDRRARCAASARQVAAASAPWLLPVAVNALHAAHLAPTPPSLEIYILLCALAATVTVSVVVRARTARDQDRIAAAMEHGYRLGVVHHHGGGQQRPAATGDLPTVPMPVLQLVPPPDGAAACRVPDRRVQPSPRRARHARRG